MEGVLSLAGLQVEQGGGSSVCDEFGFCNHQFELLMSGGCVVQGPSTERDKLKKIHDAFQINSRVRVTLTNYRKGGQHFLNHVQITPLLGSSGQVTHMLSILADVTQHKMNPH